MSRDEPEELTAEERALLAAHPYWTHEAKLLRLYDAALARLPEGMQHCTIQFLECRVGHGRLTAPNWVDSGCLVCERDAALARAEMLAELVSSSGEQILAAESRLAEVLNLLNDCHYAIIGRPVWGQPEPKGDSSYDGLRKRIYDAFHTRQGAPAAAGMAPDTVSLEQHESSLSRISDLESERDDARRRYYTEAQTRQHLERELAASRVMLRMANESTIREARLVVELRAESEQLSKALVAAREQIRILETYAVRHVEKQRDTARADVELWKRQARTEELTVADARKSLDAYRALVERIEAELQGVKQWTDKDMASYAAEHIDSALTLIRAAKEGS